MSGEKVNIGLAAYLKDAPTETFVRAHKKFLDGNVEFFYGGPFPQFSELAGEIIQTDSAALFRIKLLSKLGKKIDWKQESFKALVNYVKKRDIKLFYAEYGPTAAGLLPLCRELHIPLIVNFHGYDVYSAKVVKTFEHQYREIFQYASHIIAVSKHMKGKLVELGCPESKITHTPCAPGDDFFTITPAFNAPNLVFVGSFNDKKAPHLTILAFEKLLKRIPDTRLTMIGTGEYLDLCKTLVKALHIENAVSFKGLQPPDEIRKQMVLASGYVQHSVTAPNGDCEGTPVAVLEASAAGLPVISTRHTGIMDVVIENETGFLSDEFDISGMAENMFKVLSDLEAAKRMGQKAREHVQANFSMKTHMGIINKLVHATLAK